MNRLDFLFPKINVERIFLSVVFLTLLVLFSPPGDGQWKQTSGPGGFVGHLVKHNTLVFSSLGLPSSGSIYCSSDQGDTWSQCSGSLPIGGALASNGEALLAAGDGGVYVSTDAGTSWVQSTNQGLFASNPDVFAVQGTLFYAGALYGGVCRSSNNGYTWRPKYNGLTDLNVASLAVDGSTVYAGTQGAAAFFRTLDSGQTWQMRSSGVGSYIIRAIIAKDSLVLAGTYRSTDSGATWTLANTGIESSNLYVVSFASSGELVLAGDIGGAGVAVSQDWGMKWRLVNEGFPEDCGITTLLVDSPFVFAGTVSAGIWRRPIQEIVTEAGAPPTHSLPPSSFTLAQNYPNPFNVATEIEYEISNLEDVKLTVYDLLGREVKVLAKGRKTIGRYQAHFDASGLASGMYIYRLTAGDFQQTRKMVFMK